MKIKIQTEKGEKEIDLKMKGRHAMAIWKKMYELDDAVAENNPKKVLEYKEYLDSIACEISGFTLEELYALDIEEKQKITAYIQEKVKSEINFLKP